MTRGWQSGSDAPSPQKNERVAGGEQKAGEGGRGN